MIKYAVYAFAAYKQRSVFTDFKLLAYGLAVLKAVSWPEVYMIDNDSGEFVWAYVKRAPVQEGNHSSLRKG